MNLTPQEQAVLNIFDRMSLPKVRFAHLETTESADATRTLVEKGILAPLADGEYWLTEQGVELLQ